MKERKVAGSDCMQRGTVDFTEGSIPGHLIRFSVPMLLGNLLQALYSTVDSFWVGRYLGPQALAAVSASGPVIHALIAFVLGLTIAITTIVAQHWGAKQEDRVSHIINNSIVLLTVTGIVITAVGIFIREPLLRLINVPPDVFEGASTYLGIYLLGLVATFLYNAASSILRGLGDSRTPLRYLAYATVTNIILDPIFIFGAGPIPRMEIAGVAYATILSQALSAVLSLAYLQRKSGLLTLRKGQWQLDFSVFSMITRIGLPASIQQTAVSLSALTVNSIVNRFGSAVMAGYGVGLRLDQFAFMPAMSGGLAVTSLVGQNLGARRDDRVRDTVRWSLILTVGITATLALVMFTIRGKLISIFTKDTGVIRVGADYLRFAALSYVPYACMFALSGVLRGAGDTVTAMFITLTSLWVVRVPLAATLSRLPSFGVRGVWIAILAGPVVGSILNYAYYKTGRWKRHVIVKHATDSDPHENGISDHPN